MHTAGVARGFSTMDIRFAFRASILRTLSLPVPVPRLPTITHLSRPFNGKDNKLHGRAWQLRCHVRPLTLRRLATTVFRASGYDLQRVVFEKTSYAYQAKVISETDIFWASHGAGMVHLPLLPKDAVAIEMFNCGHFSVRHFLADPMLPSCFAVVADSLVFPDVPQYLYAQLALHLGVRYFLMQRTEPWCYQPSTMCTRSACASPTGAPTNSHGPLACH